MEASVSNFSTTIITFVVLIAVAYVTITFTVHLGLKNIITDREVRNGIIQLTSVVTFGIIAMNIICFREK